MKVKICGVCRPQDAAAAAAAGADYVGVIFAPGGRRTQTPTSAAAIFARAGGLERVGVFANAPAGEIVRLATELQLNVIQLHGNEDEKTVAHIRTSTGCELWKTIWLNSPADLTAAIDRYGASAQGVLLDAKDDRAAGGTGTRFDWSMAVAARTLMPRDLRLIVAGGLTPDNVQQAVATLRPDVVDVATGVESAVGEKSVAAITAFVRNARL